MKYTLVVLAAITGVCANVIGAPPADQHLYVPLEDGKWRCLGNPDVVIDYGQINDDQCDCPDGSDEPGTNACSRSGNGGTSADLFYCHNEGHFPGFIERFKLNDGVCDYDKCCDGSDEYKSGACPNKCKEIHQQFVSFSKRLRRDSAVALVQRDRLIKEARAIREKLEHKIDKLKHHQKVNGDGDNGEAKDTNDDNGDGVRDDVMNKIVRSVDAVEAKIALLESIMTKMMDNYNPNFNDGAVKEAIKDFQNYMSEQYNDDDDDDDESSSQLSKLLQSLKLSPSSSSSKVNEANEVNKQIKQYQTDIDIFTQELNRYYGKDDIYRALNDIKISTDYGDYKYKIALLDSIHQDKVLVGKFANFDEHDESILYYTNGSKCWNGPHRSARIILVCGKTHEIISISEPEKCEYTIEMTSPIACHELTEEDIINRFKVDFSQL
ncbi:uncharacterized protein KQ657_002931 [Scheffersomyces spartinae]|uniref:Glucosidase 2 subunit beta n=1 Tax=Scheffersomyces spartinae TaxID=45513 RepID=A0A9P7V5B6_9ASCO|nr:uncharacterized protein KQ657_002931 [Scheffersomyces spartinae]KAG7191662.1 hypothetical protein KQ657_002931 [Scheffersomyces spartinae]